MTFNWIIISVLYFITGSVLSYRLIDIHVNESEQYTKKALASDRVSQNLPAQRGIVMDANGLVLADNIISHTLIADLVQLNEVNTIAYPLATRMAYDDPNWKSRDAVGRGKLVELYRKRILTYNDPQELIGKNLAYSSGMLAQALGMDAAELEQAIVNSKQKRLVISKNISEEDADKIEELKKNWRLQGFTLEKNLSRQYMRPSELAHVLGYVNHENIGQCGIEATFDGYLRGQDGYRQFARNPRGQLLSISQEDIKEPVDGLNLQLTVDMQVQSIIEQELDAGLQEFNAKTGAIVVIEPASGNIMGMVSRPSFDLNKRLNIQSGSLNYAIQGIYEPGSTFKAIAAGAALDCKKATLKTGINCEGGSYSVYGTRITDTHPYGTLPLEMVIAKSSNIGAYKLANMVGAERFGNYVSNFGFGKRTGIDLANESPGIVRSSKNPVDFSRLSYGYAVSATPLQIAMLYACVANDGKLMRPRLIEAITTRDGTLVKRPEPEIVKQVISSKSAAELRQALAMVTMKNVGTATLANVAGYSVAGKTGTARKHNPRGGYIDGSYIVSFVGFMPAEKPRFVCLVVLDNPKKAGITTYGGTMAAPIFAKVAQRLANVLNMQPELAGDTGKAQPLTTPATPAINNTRRRRR